MKKINVLNIFINQDDLESIVNSSISLIKNKKKHYICVPNSFLTVVANENKKIMEIINSAEFVIPDGMPLVWYSKILKEKLKKRISGYQFFERYCEQLSKEGLSCFFLGGINEKLILDLIENLKKNFKNIKIAGYYIPPFVEKIEGKLNEEIISKINEAKPDVVWVGVSAPKQEIWIYENLEKINTYMACGVGAVFDFYSKRIKRAPNLLQEMGLEWFYRIICEPRRLLKKYFIYNTKFILLVLKTLIKKGFKICFLFFVIYV